MNSSPSILHHANPRKQGDSGLGLAIGWYASRGQTVCVPLTDSQDYDLIADDSTGPRRVQVKTTTYRTKYDVYEVGLRVKGGNQSGAGAVKYFDPSTVDELFVLTSDGEMYLIPADEVRAKSALCLGAKVEKYRIAW